MEGLTAQQQYQADYYQANRARKLEAARIRRESQREENAEYARKYRKEQPEKYRNSLRSWRSRNPEKKLGYQQRRDALKRGATSSVPYARQDLWAASSFCHWCGLEMMKPRSGGPCTFSIDHVVPLSRGGADTIENVVGAHLNCNQARSDKLVSELPDGWIEERRRIMAPIVGASMNKENE